jgi:hypothetical protein
MGSARGRVRIEATRLPLTRTGVRSQQSAIFRAYAHGFEPGAPPPATIKFFM